MKIINELSKRELANLNETQIDAYIDIELAQKNITKPINAQIDYPDYLALFETMPERDMTIYSSGGYSFPDIETAQKFVGFINQLPTVNSNYDWNIGSEAKYANDIKYPSESITIEKVYSEAKFTALKEQLKQIITKKKEGEKQNETTVESLIDYEAIDQVKYEIKNKAREAIEFFDKAEKIASEYQKYFSITQDEATAKETLFTVYNVQDSELKDEITNLIERPLNK